MSTDTKTQDAKPPSVADFSREVLETDPKTALELALAENERLREEGKVASDVTLDEGGFHATNLAGAYRLGHMYARSELVPETFKEKPENCAIVIQMANRWGIDPFMALQNIYVVNGRPALEAKLAIALAYKYGVFKGPIEYHFEGEGSTRKCTATAVMADGGETVKQEITMKLVKDMGWWDKSKSLWPKMTDRMFEYRAAMWLIRLRAPHVLMGLLSKDEAEELGDPTTRGTSVEEMRAVMQELLNGSDATDDRAADVSPPSGSTENEASGAGDAAPETDVSGSKSGEPSMADQIRQQEAHLHDRIEAASGVNDVQTIADGLDSDPFLTDEGRERLRAEAEGRIKQLTPSSGNRSNKPRGKPTGELFKTDESHTEAG